jgi:nicotinate-nucleotide pyrophosphorylase (carboxylating)
VKKPELPDYVIADIPKQVRAALEEDVGSGDITAQLIAASARATATVISREDMVLCGSAWVDEVFAQLGGAVSVTWHAADGDRVSANGKLCSLSGNARQILTGERTALNFLQTLSGTATVAREFADAVAGKPVTLLDTRKTLPGLRTAQKYAVLCGGCENHRIALYDAFLIKENHIAACGSIGAAIQTARQLAADKKITVEVENLAELDQAIAARPEQIMLDNFSDADREVALARIPADIIVELSGNVSLDTLQSMPTPPRPVSVSLGALTKHVRAIDLSLRLGPQAQ